MTRYHTTADGNIPFTAEEEAARDAEEAAAQIPKVPESVTMRQARLALLAAGVLATVDAAVASAGDAAKIEWEYATEVKRDWPLVVQMATALGLDLDALMIAAEKL